MKPRPKHYRQRIYDYVEGMLGRPLSLDEHDDLRDIISEYAFSITNLRAQFRRLFCRHEWKVDKKIEGGEKITFHVKCMKCDRRTQQKMPVHSMRVG